MFRSGPNGMPPVRGLLRVAIVAAAVLASSHGSALAMPEGGEGQKPPPKGVEGAGPVEAVPDDPKFDPNSATPPPSTYDMRKQVGDDPVEDEGPSLLTQLGRTLFALLIVVAMIYGFGRLAMARLGRGLRFGGGGNTLKVVERVPLDNRHTLFLVEVQGGPALVLGTGEGGVRLVKELEGVSLPQPGTVTQTGPDPARGKPFKDVLAKGHVSPSPLPKEPDA